MYNYAIYYFMNAAKAKPNDSRMWTALGSCYEKIDKKNEALKCYEKALFYKDKEGIALYKMAKIYQTAGDEERAAACFKENLRKNNSEEVDNAELVESYLFLAKYHRNKGEYKEAHNFLIKLKDHEGQVIM
jgi:anaphase-promoting complex subunit 8